MFHREDQVIIKANQYDVVRSKKTLRVMSGVMNSYNKTVERTDFDGYGLVLDLSDSFAHVYLPNRSRKLLKISNLIVVAKWNKNNKKM
jgi:hypothetical protein